MERNIGLEEISGGKRYEGNDLIKADCSDCEGCSAYCQDMRSSILLGPYDIKRMEEGLYMDFNQLTAGHIKLNMVDHVILPDLKMTGSEGRCSFLDGYGRYSVHPYRPGFRRLFPLGGACEDRSFQYLLQIHERSRENRTKIKVRKWVGTSDFKSYEQFVVDWYYFLKDLGEQLKESGNQEAIKTMNMYMLNQFYITPYKAGEGPYPQSYRRLGATIAIVAV